MPDITDIDQNTDFLSTAMHWYGFGLNVIPIVPGTKKTAVKWDPWLEGLGPEKIVTHWKQHPDHEVGFIVGDDMIVFDADTPESIARLYEIENALDVTPLLVTETSKGEHHFYCREAGSIAKTDAHSSEKHPERIDVKAKRSMVVLAPSGGKEILLAEALHCSELSIANQDFIDAIARNNGRESPKLQTKNPEPRQKKEFTRQDHKELVALVNKIDPDCGHQDWINMGITLHNETNGSEEGFEIFDAWSSRGTKYQGRQETWDKWNHFGNYNGRPLTRGTLNKMVEDAGYDWKKIIQDVTPKFQKLDTETEVIQSKCSEQPQDNSSNILEKYSLTGTSAHLEKQALEEIFVLAGIALLGQWTTLFSKPNVGKTLLTFYLLINAILQGRIAAKNVFILNLDDTHSGLTTKTKIAEKYGFHLLCDGYKSFKVSDFIPHIEALIKNKQTRGKVLVLDTLKKFTSTMDKSALSKWNQVMRRFITHGGTVIALAHTNKKLDKDDKPVPAGVSDMVDDIDCGYTIAPIGTDDENQIKTIVFENIKRRGNVVRSAAYRYSIKDGQTYEQLLDSIEKVDQAELDVAKHNQKLRSDSEVIDAISTCIDEGINTKMLIRDTVNERASVSKRRVLDVIEKYTGDDPDQHRWNFTVQERGKHVFHLLN